MGTVGSGPRKPHRRSKGSPIANPIEARFRGRWRVLRASSSPNWSDDSALSGGRSTSLLSGQYGRRRFEVRAPTESNALSADLRRLCQAWRYDQFRRPLDLLPEMPQDLSATMRILVQLRYDYSSVGTLSFPSLVRSARHAMHQLRSLHAFVIDLLLRLWGLPGGSARRPTMRPTVVVDRRPLLASVPMRLLRDPSGTTLVA